MPQRNRIWMIGVCSLAIIAGIGSVTRAPAQDPDDIVFHDDYNKAIREAKLTKKPIFLEFRCEP